MDPLADLAPEWTPYRFAFNNPLTYIDPTGLFETRAEAKEYRKGHGISGRIQRGSDGIFSINDRLLGYPYFKHRPLQMPSLQPRFPQLLLPVRIRGI